jgi:DNA-binding MarR family transcriptional regulator
MTDTGFESGSPRTLTGADPNLAAIREFVDFVGKNVRSARQRERLVRAARVPLTGAGLSALRTIERHGPITVTDVARRLGVDQSTASRQLRPLEEQGLVTRATVAADGRLASLSVSGKGREVLERVDAVIVNDFDVALSDWSDDDRSTLAALLDRFRVGLLHPHADDSGWSVRKD